MVKRLKGEDLYIRDLKFGKRFKVGKYYGNAYEKLKKEVSRKASMANKRLVRLENNNLESLPAYKAWQTYSGGVKFSVKGKDYNELQKELSRLNHFLNSETSLVRSANKLMKDIAKETGIKYSKVSELPQKTKVFFEIASKVEQYLKNTTQTAWALGYQKIWQQVNQYVKDERIDLSGAKLNVDEIVKKVTELLDYENVERGLTATTNKGVWFNPEQGIPWDDI